MLLQDLCIISKPSVNLNWNYSPEMLNSGQNWQFFVLCDLENWRMTLKNNRAPLLRYCKLCASSCSHLWIQTGVMAWKCPNWGKICFDLSDLDLWPLPLTFCMDTTSVNGIIHDDTIEWEEHCEKGATDVFGEFDLSCHEASCTAYLLLLSCLLHIG